MRYIEILFRDGTAKTYPFEVVQQVLESEEKIVMLYDSEGNWTGEAINKADIKRTQRNYDQERQEQVKLNPPIPTEIPIELVKSKRPDFIAEALEHGETT